MRASCLLLVCSSVSLGAVGCDIGNPSRPDSAEFDLSGIDQAPPDQSAIDALPLDLFGVDPLSAPPGCASQSSAQPGPSENMRPGEACITCHANNRNAPIFEIAGTVFAFGHETDDCNGASGPAQSVADARVVITDRNGTYTLQPLAPSGNFACPGWRGCPDSGVTYPYSARVIYQGRERAMSALQSEGDCNRCHTVAGLPGGPAGRVTLPAL